MDSLMAWNLLEVEDLELWRRVIELLLARLKKLAGLPGCNWKERDAAARLERKRLGGRCMSRNGLLAR